MSSRESSTKRRPARASLLLLLVALLAVLSAVRNAEAQNAEPLNRQDGCLKDPVCKEHYDIALKLYDTGKYADALPQFEECYSRRQMPWLLLNIGRTLQRLGRAEQAIAYYERYKKSELNLDQATLDRVNKYIEQSKLLLEKGPEYKPLDHPLGLEPGQTAANGQTNGQTNGPGLTPDVGTPKDTASKPIYKKWSYKKFFLSDGGRCWNRG